MAYQSISTPLGFKYFSSEDRGNYTFIFDDNDNCVMKIPLASDDEVRRVYSRYICGK
jgi:hypothetical protein